MVLAGRPREPGAVIDSTHLKQWRGYANGTRIPRRTLVECLDQVERLRSHESRSGTEFNSVLWEVLAARNPAPSVVCGWLERLDERVIRAVRDAPSMTLGHGSRYKIPKLRVLELLRLRNLPSLDSLALLSLVLTQASRFGQAQLAYNCACETVTMLWQLVRVLDRRKVAFALMEYFEEWVLPLANLNALQPSIGRCLEKRIPLLEWAAQERQRRYPRENDAVASAKLVRRAASEARWFNALQLQYAAVHKLVPGREPTASELARLWWEMGVTELLQMDSIPWSSAMEKLGKLHGHLVRVMTGAPLFVSIAAPAASTEPETRDSYQAAVRALRAYCPLSMRGYDKLVEIFSTAH